MRNLKSYKILLIFFFLQFFGAHFAMAQLSSKHYLPPLKRSGSSSEFAGQAFYLSTPETSAFDVHVYQGTNTTPVAILSISNTSSGKYEPTLGTGGFVAYGSNNTSFVTDAYAGIVLSSAGFRFEAPGGQEFYVNWRASHSAQAASLVSAGEAGLGTDFKWGGSPLVDVMSGSFSGSSYQNHVNSVIGIMATEDNTTVTISGYDPGCTFTNASGQNGITADVINITLNAGQSYVLEARPTGLTSATSPNNQGWLGATISSNKKIALNQGHLLLSFNTGNLDMSMTQITPTTNIGKEYVFIRGLGGDKPEFPVIIATENNTDVYVNGDETNGTLIATLNDGEWIKIPSNKYSQSGTLGGYQGANMYVKASKNVYAFQTLDAGTNNDMPANADVFQIAPLNCLLDNGVNNIANITEAGKAGYNPLTTIYLMIMASSAINAADIVIKYGPGAVNTIPSSTISTARKPVLGTDDWVTYFVLVPSPQGDVSVYAPGPVAVAYLGYSSAVGIGGYFSGFGSIPTIDVATTGDGCFPNTTLTATPGFTSYAWYKDGVLMPSVTTNSFTPTIAGDYYVEVFRGACSYPSATKTVYDCNPEVVVRNTASKKYLLPGETTTFTITVKMLGGSAAQNMQISNVLPAHLTYTSSTLTTGTFTGSGSNYTWNVGTMTNGEEQILRVLATAQSVTTPYAETYTVNNTQTFGLGTETNNLADDKTEDVVIYPACSNTLAGTISGAASYCSTTNTTTLTASNAFGDLQWQSSTDNSIFTDIGSATTATLPITNLASTTYYRMKATVDACIAYSPSVAITVTQGPTGTLSSASGTDAQSLCENTALTTITYSTSNATGATFSGLPSGVTGSYASNVVTISGTPTATGSFNYTVTLAGSCDVNLTGSILVSNTNNTISLTSASGTDAQAACINAAITTVSYATAGASGASFTGLPAGVTGAWSNNVVTLTGTPTVAGSYSYTINLTGGCGTVSATGSFTVIQNSIALTSASGTDAQSICTNSAMTNLTYSTTGATGASFSGLPSGVTGTWSNNVVTINGSPTTAGNASFTITLTGGCGTVTATGSLTVTALPTLAVSTQGDACATKTTLTATAGYSSYTWYKDNVAIAGVTGDSYTPTAAGDYKVSVSNGSCSTTSSVTTIYTCGLTAEGKMLAVTNAVSLLSTQGGVNFGTVIDDLGRIVNTTGLTTTVGTIGATTAVIGGVISSTNGIASSVGVIYSTDSNFGTYSTATIQSNAAAGTYTSTLTGLTSLTTYHAKTFIVNLAGTSYGAEISFTTLAAAPTLAATTTVSSIASTTATSGGNITSDGGAAVTARGIVWGTTPDPTIALTTKTTDGTGTGAFTSSLTGLTPATLYYVRSYATNAIGTVYGAETSFTTLAVVPTQAAITTEPSGAVNGVALTLQPVVRITDASGNTATTSTVSVVASIASGSGGTLSGTTTVAAVNGVATFTNLVLSGTPGNFTLSFTPTLLTAATSSSFALSVGAPSKVMITNQPAGAFTGTVFSTQPAVKITDAGGNTITSSTANVVASIASGSGTLSGTTTVAAVNGVATFTNLKITGTGDHTLTFTPAGGLTAATSNTLNVAVLGCAQGGPCAIGDTGPGGGTVFYYSAAGFSCGPDFTSTCHYLEVAPNTWYGGTADPSLRWDYTAWSDENHNGYPNLVDDPYPNVTAHINASEIGLGYKCSVYLFNIYGNNSDYAAGAARRYTGGGKTDWYLGTSVEMNLLSDWSKGNPSTPLEDSRSGTMIRGGFSQSSSSATHYWTASQLDWAKENAYRQDFLNNGAGGGGQDHKSFERKVRPIRAF